MKQQLVFLFAILCSFSNCTRSSAELEAALDYAGKNRIELEKVIAHYEEAEDDLKLKAAHFLIENLYGLSHYQNDSSYRSDGADKIPQELHPDVGVITAQVLIQNIDLAFQEWQKPWSRHLSFEQFCEYILPYKVGSETPAAWRSQFIEQHKDTLAGVTDVQEACSRVNKRLKWFGFAVNSHPDVMLTLQEMVREKKGHCVDCVNLSIYHMRAVGIPVAMDFIPLWANRDGDGHSWNVLLTPTGGVPFNGTESNPGKTKVEFATDLLMTMRRPKIFRRTYGIQKQTLAYVNQNRELIPAKLNDLRMRDVTKEYMPVSDVTVQPVKPPRKTDYAYLSIFDNKEWRPIYWGKIEADRVTFKEMGRNIVYLPSFYINHQLHVAGQPFLLTKNGETVILRANTKVKRTAKLLRKYPSDDSNTIKTGDDYELFYWGEDKWVSLGRRKAEEECLVYDNLPENALFWLDNSTRGKQERIFTIVDGKQIWW